LANRATPEKGEAALTASKAEKLKKIKAIQPPGESKHKIIQILRQTIARDQNE